MNSNDGDPRIHVLERICALFTPNPCKDAMQVLHLNSVVVLLPVYTNPYVSNWAGFDRLDHSL